MASLCRMGPSSHLTRPVCPRSPPLGRPVLADPARPVAPAAIWSERSEAGRHGTARKQPTPSFLPAPAAFGVFLFPYVLILIESSDALPFSGSSHLRVMREGPTPLFCAMEPYTASFVFCIHFVHDLLCACLDEPSLLHA